MDLRKLDFNGSTKAQIPGHTIFITETEVDIQLHFKRKLKWLKCLVTKQSYPSVCFKTTTGCEIKCPQDEFLIDFSLNHQKHKVGISVSHFFHFIFSFKFISPIPKFGGKCYLFF